MNWPAIKAKLHDFPSAAFITQAAHALFGGWVTFLGYALGVHYHVPWLGAKLGAMTFVGLYAVPKEALYDPKIEGQSLVPYGLGDLAFLAGGPLVTLAILRHLL